MGSPQKSIRNGGFCIQVRQEFFVQQKIKQAGEARIPKSLSFCWEQRDLFPMTGALKTRFNLNKTHIRNTIIIHKPIHFEGLYLCGFCFVFFCMTFTYGPVFWLEALTHRTLVESVSLPQIVSNLRSSNCKLHGFPYRLRTTRQRRHGKKTWRESCIKALVLWGIKTSWLSGKSKERLFVA